MFLRQIAVTIFITVLLVGCAPSRQNQVLNFGIEMAQKGLWQEAAFRWRTELTQSGPTAALLNNLAIAAESAGDFPEAERLYQEALKLAPAHPVISDNQQQFLKLKKGELPLEEEDMKSKRGERPPRGEEK